MISAEDRGFVFGDGVYEVWRVIEGRPFETDAHLARLAFGLGELRIAPPAIAQRTTFDDVARRLLEASGLERGEATIYLEITRGAAPRTHQFPPAGTRPTVFAVANRLETPEALRVRGARAITTPDIRWLRCDIKTIQLLPNILAKQAAIEVGATDALFVRDGFVTEGSHTNVFAVVDGTLRTHPATNLVLPGVTRRVVLDIARRLAMPLREEPLAARDLARVEELFLVGTTTDVMPVVRVNELTIGSGSPGPIAKRLHEELHAMLNSSGRAEYGATAAVAS